MKSVWNEYSKPIRSLAGFGLATLWVALIAGSARADLVDQWNTALLDSIRTEDTAPCLAARNLAILHGAMYDASVAVKGTTQPFYYRTQVRSDLSLEAALNAAAFYTAKNLHPSRIAAFNDLYERLQTGLARDGDQEAGAVLGRKIGAAWINWRVGDGSSRVLTYIPKTEPGAWKRTLPFFRPPDLPGWCLVQPFTLVGAAQFRPPGPPSLDSPRYAEELNALKKYGGIRSADRTAEQTEIARFWADFSYTVAPPGHWNQIAQNIAATKQFSLIDKVRLFAVLNVTMADVGVACWEAKYFYNFWRPVTAIRAAETDGNPATEPDKEWKSLLNTPSFPEYVSGHSAFSGAGADVLKAFLGTDSVDFTVPSDSLPGKIRSFHRLSECAYEISQSRMYGGIHFPSALNDGLDLGRKIAAHVLANFFKAEEPGHDLIFTAPAELKSGYWIGLKSSQGQSAAIERIGREGKWEPWTNGIASGPILRWKVSDPLDPKELRAVFQ